MQESLGGRVSSLADECSRLFAIPGGHCCWCVRDGEPLTCRIRHMLLKGAVRRTTSNSSDPSKTIPVTSGVNTAKQQQGWRSLVRVGALLQRSPCAARARIQAKWLTLGWGSVRPESGPSGCLVRGLPRSAAHTQASPVAPHTLLGFNQVTWSRHAVQAGRELW